MEMKRTLELNAVQKASSLCPSFSTPAVKMSHPEEVLTERGLLQETVDRGHVYFNLHLPTQSCLRGCMLLLSLKKLTFQQSIKEKFKKVFRQLW